MNIDATNNVDAQCRYQKCKDLTEEEEMSATKSHEEAIELQKYSRDNAPQILSTMTRSNTVEHLKHYNHRHRSSSPHTI